MITADIATTDATKTNRQHVTLGTVPRSRISEYWPLLRPLLESAMSHGMRLPVDALLADAYLGNVTLWAVVVDDRIVGAAATQVIDYSGGQSALRVVALSGDQFSLWEAKIIEAFERTARSFGAQTIEAVGRKGWARKLDRYGFEPRYVTFIKEVKA